jgi:dihydroorotate dehydrogenase electron transfer subunit
MKKRFENLKVVNNKLLNNEFFILKLQPDNSLPEILPGQFDEVRVDGSPNTFLRRPISIYDVDYSQNTLDILIKIAGKGTLKLSTLKKGDQLNLIYPLGNSFTKPQGSKVLLIGGGTGVAPMLLLGKYLLNKYKIKPQFLFGYRSKELIVEIERFEAFGDVFLTTEDGSKGQKGFVINHSLIKEKISEFDRVYACGPEIMMKEIARISREMNVECEVSLENLMGCGFGACLCCIVDTIDKGNVNTCTEGPVFNTKRLRWQI